MKSSDSDNATLTGGAILRRPRNLVVFLFFCVCLTMFRICLTSIIRINAATACNFEFHCRAMELLYHTRALLNFKDL